MPGNTSLNCQGQNTAPRNGRPRCRCYCSSPSMTGLRCAFASVSYRQSTVTLLGRLPLPGKDKHWDGERLTGPSPICVGDRTDKLQRLGFNPTCAESYPHYRQINTL